ncbi:MAG: zinc ribbon domain-containing protein, partial [Gammaproteobacteria bacterium]
MKRITTYLNPKTQKPKLAGLNVDAGYYRCHDRCGCRGIKQETIEKAVVDILITDLMTLNTFKEIKQEIKTELSQRQGNQKGLLENLETELKEVDRQIKDVVELLPKVKHQRPLLDRFDHLEEQRLEINNNIETEKETSNPTILRLSDELLEDYVERQHKDLL